MLINPVMSVPLNPIRCTTGILCYNLWGKRDSKEIKCKKKKAYSVIGIRQPGNDISSLRPWSPAGSNSVQTICSFTVLLEPGLCTLVGLPILNHLQGWSFKVHKPKPRLIKVTGNGKQEQTGAVWTLTNWILTILGLPDSLLNNP